MPTASRGARRSRTCGRRRCSASSSAGHCCWYRLPVFWWSLPLTAGYLVAIPFAVLTASPALGRFFQKLGLCGIPEDFSPPAEIKAIGLAENAMRPYRQAEPRLMTLKRDPEFASLKRSFDVYYGDPSRDAAMDALYARFLEPGQLAFDIGSSCRRSDRQLSPRGRPCGRARTAAAVRAGHPDDLCRRHRRSPSSKRPVALGRAR